MAAAAPHRIEIVPWAFWKHSTNWTGRTQNSATLGGGYSSSSGAQNDMIGWVVLLQAGTWSITTVHFTGTGTYSRGIYTVSLDTTDVGTFDGYGSDAANTVSTISGITVASTGFYDLKYTMKTKHAFASAYYGVIQYVILQRTAA